MTSTTIGRSPRDAICRAASIPPIPGRRMSINTRSGRRRLGLLDALFATTRPANPLKPSRCVDHRMRSVVERELVIDNQDPDRRGDRTQGRHCTMLTAPGPPVECTRMCKRCERTRVPASLSECLDVWGRRACDVDAVTAAVGRHRAEADETGKRSRVGAGACVLAVRRGLRVVRPCLCSGAPVGETRTVLGAPFQTSLDVFG